MAIDRIPTDMIVDRASGVKLSTSLAESVQKHSDYVKAKNPTEIRSRSKFYFFDSFARTDSITDLGIGETNNLAYTYTAVAGTTATWGIENGSVKAVSITPSANRALAYQETNESDCVIEADVKVSGTSNGLSFRITDITNFIYVAIQPDLISVSKIVGGTLTNLGTTSKTFSDCRLSVYLKGNKIEVFVDGFRQLTAYDSFNNTATKHGLYSRMADFTFRWDTFAVKELSSVPFNVKSGFENTLSQWYWQFENAGLPYSLTYDTIVKKTDNKSLRIELRKDDPDVSSSKRSEVVLPAERCLEEHWYGVSVYLPKGGTEDYVNDTEPEIIMQWHNTADSGEADISPPLCVETYNGRYTLKSRVDTGRFSASNTLTTYAQDMGSYEDDKGKWVDWLFHVRWGYLEQHEPILEVYKNGELLVNRNGYPNTVNDKTGVYLKLGLYKWAWKIAGNTSTITKRVIYYDDFFMK